MTTRRQFLAAAAALAASAASPAPALGADLLDGLAASSLAPTGVGMDLASGMSMSFYSVWIKDPRTGRFSWSVDLVEETDPAPMDPDEPLMMPPDTLERRMGRMWAALPENEVRALEEAGALVDGMVPVMVRLDGTPVLVPIRKVPS